MNTVSNFSVDIATYVFLALIVYFSLDRRNSYKFSDKIVLAEFEDGYNDERSSQCIDVDLDFQKTNKSKKLLLESGWFEKLILDSMFLFFPPTNPLSYYLWIFRY